jgi:phosphoserine phosphatase RsbU/P
MAKSISTAPAKFDVGSIKPADLPAPPQAALALIKACSRPNVSNQELAKLASSDLILSAELLRVVNTPFFGFSGKVQSVARAIVLLGIRALKSLVLCLAVRDALKPDALANFDVVSYWENALRHATAARLLGRVARLDADECFTAGLLQDFGLLVLFHLNPETASRWSELSLLDPDARYAAEREIFGTQHDTVVALLAKAWGLPDELAAAVGKHHAAFPVGSFDEASDASANKTAHASALCRVLHCADWVAALFSVSDAAVALEQTRRRLVHEFALDAGQIDALLADIPSEVESAANALGLNINQQNDFEHTMREANLRLAEENLSYQELTWRLEQTLKDRDRLASELDRELALAREIQQSLMPEVSPPGSPIHGINLSAHQLSGDFYDFFSLPDGRLYFILGDVSGKGVNAALLMSKASSLFRCLGKDIHEPGRLLARINQEMCETSTRGMFVTAIAGLYDPGSQRICLVNAGHPPALLFGPDGRGKAFSAETTPLGIVPDQQFEGVEFSLGEGCLYLYSDGVTEGCLADGTEMGMEGLIRCLKKVNKLPAAERLGVVVKEFQHEASSLRDDITLLLIEAHHD